MNFKNRLKNIERKTGIKYSDYCHCYGEVLKWEVVPISIDEWNRRFDTGEETMTRLPDKCETCKKQIDKRFIEVTFEQAKATVETRIKQVEERLAKFAD